jgi:hypothetical protein
MEDIRIIKLYPRILSHVEKLSVKIIDELPMWEVRTGTSQFDIDSIPINYSCSKCGNRIDISVFIQEMTKNKIQDEKETFVCLAEEYAGRRCLRSFELTANITYKQ